VKTRIRQLDFSDGIPWTVRVETPRLFRPTKVELLDLWRDVEKVAPALRRYIERERDPKAKLNAQVLLEHVVLGPTARHARERDEKFRRIAAEIAAEERDRPTTKPRRSGSIRIRTVELKHA